MYSILVKPIGKNEMWATRIKRGLEQKIIDKYLKKHKS